MVSLLIAATLSVKLLSPMCMAPCEFFIDVKTVSDPGNRVVVIVLDGENYYRSTELIVAPTERDGKLVYPPQTVRIRFPSVPAGSYELLATLKRNDSEKAVVRLTAQVVGGMKQ